MSDPLGTMTERQRQAWPEYVSDAARYCEINADGKDLWNWTISFAEETRPGRGHDMDASWCDGEHFVQIRLDVYGNGTVSVAETSWLHNSANEECDCDYCEKEREEDE